MEKLRIVIVMPAEKETRSLRRQLEFLGHSVIGEARGHSEALDLVRKKQPDAMLLALGANGRHPPDGLILAQELEREHPLPVVVVSNHETSTPTEYPGINGSDDLLVLPFDDGELAWALASAVARFREREELHQLRLQAQRKAALLRISAELAAALDEDEICERVVQGLHETLGYGFLGLLLLDENTGERALRASIGWPDAPDNWRVPPGQGLSERPLLDGQLHYTPDVTQDALFIPGLECGSEVDVPLRLGRDILGVLVAENALPNAFDQDDFEVLRAAANLTAIAISKARLLAAERQRADELDALRATIADISNELELPRLLEEILKRAVLLLDATGGDLGLFDDTTQEIEIAVSHNMGQDFAGTRQVLGEGAMGCVAQTGEPLIVRDYQNWNGRSPSYDQGPWHTVVAAPLVAGTRLVGAIGIVDSDPTRKFSTSDLRLLDLFAQQSAIAVEKARLFEESQRRTQELAALYDTALALSGVLETKSLLSRLYTQIQQLMNPDSFGVFLYHADAQELEITLAMEADQEVTDAAGMRVPVEDGGLTGWVIRTRQPLLIADLQVDPTPIPPKHITRPARSWLGVPLIARDRLVGAISIQCFRPNAFDEGDRRILESLATQVAIAIESARLFEAQRQQADELARLHRASAALFFTPATDLPTLAQNIVEAILSEFGQANCSLLLLNPTTDELERVGAAGRYVPQVRQAQLALDGPGLVPLAMRTKQIVNVADVLTDDNYVANWDRARSEMTVPLKVGDRVIGALDVQSSRAAAFGPVDERLLTLFAERAALALENARLYQETARRAEEMASLHEIGLATVSSLSLERVLAAIYEQCRAVLPCDTFSVAFHRPGERTITFPVFIHHGESIEVTPLEFETGEGFTSYIIKERRPMILDAKSAYLDHRPVRPVLAAPPPADTYLGVPLVFRDEVIGVLSVQSSAPNAYNGDHVRLLTTIAAQAAIAIENARYYEDIQEYAASLQVAAHENEELLEQVQRHAEKLEQEVAARTAEIYAEKVKVDAILKSAGDAIILTGPDNRVSYVNDAFCSLTGYAAEDVVGESTHKVLCTEHSPSGTQAAIEQATTQGLSWRGDVLAVHRDGHVIETEMTLAPVRDASDHILGFVGSLRDVSQTRALERAKSEFLTNVSHQLRTPVTNLKTFAYLLNNGRPEQRAHYVDIMGRQIEKLTHLIQDVLEIAELDVGPIVTDWNPVAPATLLNVAATRFRADAQTAELTLDVVQPDEQLPPIYGSASRLAQALNQIVENALLYTDQGEIVIGCRLDNSTEPAARELVLWVSDTGPGISPDEQKQLFGRFFRGKAAEPGHIIGTGLGLSVAKMIVEAHRGCISVHSLKGKGSTFELRFPIPD